MAEYSDDIQRPALSEKKKLTFNKAQKRAYRDVIRDIRAMDEAKQVGKHKITLTPKIIRARIKKALLEVDGVQEKTAVDWANRIYQRAYNWLEDRRKFVFAKQIYERICKAHPSKSKEEIDALFEIVYRGAMKKTESAKPLPKPAYCPMVAQVQAARKAERKRVWDQNAHMRVGDFMKKKARA